MIMFVNLLDSRAGQARNFHIRAAHQSVHKYRNNFQPRHEKGRVDMWSTITIDGGTIQSKKHEVNVNVLPYHVTTDLSATSLSSTTG